MTTEIVSWNVNGLRAVAKKGFRSFMLSHQPDILLLQEIKARPDQLDDGIMKIPDYRVYFNPAQRPGYSGTAVYSKIEPIRVRYGIEGSPFDDEGRVITVEYEKYFVVNLYVPNAKRDLSRLAEKTVWHRFLREYLEELETTKPVVIGGDLNVAHMEQDLARPRDNIGNAGFTAEERTDMDTLLDAGFIDTFRHLYPDSAEYSWWTYRSNARERNIGWRIDYILISEELEPYLTDAFILSDVFGSDHCPVGIVLDTD